MRHYGSNRAVPVRKAASVCHIRKRGQVPFFLTGIRNGRNTGKILIQTGVCRGFLCSGLSEFVLFLARLSLGNTAPSWATLVLMPLLSQSDTLVFANLRKPPTATILEMPLAA